MTAASSVDNTENNWDLLCILKMIPVKGEKIIKGREERTSSGLGTLRYKRSFLNRHDFLVVGRAWINLATMR